MSADATVSVSDEGRPLTLADLAELLDRADKAGVPRTAELTARSRIRDSRLTRLETR